MSRKRRDREARGGGDEAIGLEAGAGVTCDPPSGAARHPARPIRPAHRIRRATAPSSGVLRPTF